MLGFFLPPALSFFETLDFGSSRRSLGTLAAPPCPAPVCKKGSRFTKEASRSWGRVLQCAFFAQHSKHLRKLDEKGAPPLVRHGLRMSMLEQCVSLETACLCV